jgi:hypothetical protein
VNVCCISLLGNKLFSFDEKSSWKSEEFLREKILFEKFWAVCTPRFLCIRSWGKNLYENIKRINSNSYLFLINPRSCISYFDAFW